jgi:hypothetical protein
MVDEAPRRPALRAALAALCCQGIEGEKPLWPRDRGVVPRRVRLRKEARVVVQGARGSQHVRVLRISNDDLCTHGVHFSSFVVRTRARPGESVVNTHGAPAGATRPRPSDTRDGARRHGSATTTASSPQCPGRAAPQDAKRTT